LACGCCDNNEQADKVLIELVNNGEAATVSDDRGGFLCFSGSKPTENHKNIYFLIFFCQNIWWYIKFDIPLQCQNKITNN